MLKNTYFLLLAAFFLSLQAKATNVRDYGAKGDGIHDDTKAIRDALAACSDGHLLFPAGKYRLSGTIEVDLSRQGPLGISSPGGSAVMIMGAPGPAFKVKGTHQGSALPATVTPEVWLRERMFTLENIEITGENPAADGIELQLLMQPVIRGCLIRNVRHGILLTRRNRNVLIEGNHIYNCSGTGIYLDSVNIHQMIISHSHISYCAEAGIRVRHGEIRNFQITGNDIEYNCSPGTGLQSADICMDLSKGGNVREGTISGNTIQAIESEGGANIRFSGDPAQPHKLGLWSITGNHISNQQAGILLRNTQGISITGNTFVRAYLRHLQVENSSNIIFTGNVIDYNPDYFTPEVKAAGGITIVKSRNIMVHDNLVGGVSAAPPGEEAAVEIAGCREVSVKNNQILNSAIPAVQISDSPYTALESNAITLIDKNGTALSIKGDCEGSTITGNRMPGLKVINSARNVKIKRSPH